MGFVSSAAIVVLPVDYCQRLLGCALRPVFGRMFVLSRKPGPRYVDWQLTSRRPHARVTTKRIGSYRPRANDR